MEIKGISNSMPLPGIRPAAENAPVLQSAQNPEQVTVEAVKSLSGAEKVQQGQLEEMASSTDLNQVKEAMDSIAQSLGSLSRSSDLEFSIDDELGSVVVKVVDPETREVIKQFPSEEAIGLARRFGKANGSLHQAKA